MESQEDFKSTQENIQKSLVSAVKSVNRLASEDLGFHRTINPDVAEKLDDKSARVLNLSKRLLASAATACGLNAPALEDIDDIEVNWRQIVDVVDTVLEKADTALDEYTGLIKRKEPPTAESGSSSKKQKSTAKVIRNANIAKPQAKFERQPDNFPTGPWKPILSEKPHATIPLDESLATFDTDHGPQYKHPYLQEINNMEYPKRIREVAEPVPYQPEESTKAIFVDTWDGVLEMLKELKKAQEIAIDLEHHDFRTYVGLVCLMQISTRKQDWIVDTLQPWRHKLSILNEAFADPGIIKVFHGAYMDMIWLQRDLGLYVNGLFDTYFACDELHYSGKSLAFLLSKFVNFGADKQYQLADWRLRPIPEEMMYYARSDTHYLLYIYDQLRNALIDVSEKNDPDSPLERVLQRSKELSLSRYEHPGYDNATGEGTRGWYNYVLKHAHLTFNSEQFAVFQALWRWRDQVARKEDENVNFVMGVNPLCEIARVNPPDIKALHSLLPVTAPLAKPRLNEMWEEIKQQKAKNGPSLLRFLTSEAPDDVKRNGASKPKAAVMPVQDGDVVIGRLPSSQLFGKMAISSRWDPPKQVTEEAEDHVPFPWQRFVQQVSEVDIKDAGSTPAEGVEEAMAPKIAKPKSMIDEEFTLRQNKKRKASENDQTSSSSSESESSEIDSDIDEEMIGDGNGLLAIDTAAIARENRQARKQQQKIDMAAKAERKKQKKQAERQRQEAAQQKKQEKKARKAAEKQAKEEAKEGNQSYNAVPFDYGTAASVLHSKRNNDDGATGGKKQKKAFNPYAKSAEEGVKGARKAPPIRGERSATFKK